MAAQETPAGWYPHPDGSGRMMFHNGVEFIDPFAAFEDGAADVLVPHLERMFAAGFEAGAEATAKILGITQGVGR